MHEVSRPARGRAPQAHGYARPRTLKETERDEMAAQQYVALLRGINVGKAKRIAMADLRAAYESLGLTGVRTLLNSGNVVFTVPSDAPGPLRPRQLAATLEDATAARTGVSSRVTLLTAEELTAVVEANPLAEVATDPTRLIVSVLESDAAREAIEALAREQGAGETFAFGARGAGGAGRALYLWCPDGILTSRLGALLHGKHRELVTNRNWATVTKLRALLEGASAR